MTENSWVVRSDGLGVPIPAGWHSDVLKAYALLLLGLGLDRIEVGVLVNLRGEHDCQPPWGSNCVTGTAIDIRMPWRRRAWSSLVHDGILEDAALYLPTAW